MTEKLNDSERESESFKSSTSGILTHSERYGSTVSVQQAKERWSEMNPGKHFYRKNHYNCCNVEESNFKCIGKRGLLIMRIILLTIMLFIAYEAVIIDTHLGFLF